MRPQLGAALADRCARWNQRYAWLAAALADVPHLVVPERAAEEQFVASSIQFSLHDLALAQRRAFISDCAERGVHVKWFGADEPVGFTSVWQHWRFFGEAQSLPNAERVLGGLCDMRLPLTLSQADCVSIAEVIRSAMSAVLAAAPP